MEKRRIIKTSKKEIVKYWESRVYEGDLSVDFAEANERCWRCGYECVLHRCHIIPHSLGGEDTPSNLVLLCNRCHREAPNIDDPEFFWDWLIAQGTQMYDTYWLRRGIREFEEVYKLSFWEFIIENKVDISHLYNYLKKKHPNVAIHFGEGKINPSTIAGLILQYIIQNVDLYDNDSYSKSFLLDKNPIRRAKYK